MSRDNNICDESFISILINKILFILINIFNKSKTNLVFTNSLNHNLNLMIFFSISIKFKPFFLMIIWKICTKLIQISEYNGLKLNFLKKYFLFFQPELYLCTPIRVDYTNNYFIGEWFFFLLSVCWRILL